MSQSSEITTNDINISRLNKTFNQCYACKCGKFHQFYIEYMKQFNVVFICKSKIYSIKMKDIYNHKDYSIKCAKCQNIITFNKGYFKNDDNKIKYKCESCKKKIINLI